MTSSKKITNKYYDYTYFGEDFTIYIPFFSTEKLNHGKQVKAYKIISKAIEKARDRVKKK